jgi:hypothetical protein
VTLHLRVGFGKPPGSLAEGFEWLDRVGAPNLKLAVNTAMLEQKPPAAEAAARLKDKLGLWLVAASHSDVAGKLWDAHGPIHSARNPAALARLLSVAPGIPTLLDALYANQDEEYLDALSLAKVLSQTQKP